MEIRQARRDDQGNIAALIYSAGPELYDYVYKTDVSQAKEYISYEFLSGRGFCGYRNMTVAVIDGQIVGTGSFYDREQCNHLLLGTLMNMLSFFGLRRIWSVLLRSGRIASVKRRPEPGQLYLANFGVAQGMRGKGIGSALIHAKLAEVNGKGYQVFALDVAETNPGAERLYHRLGMHVVRFNDFCDRHLSMMIPNVKRMEMPIA